MMTEKEKEEAEKFIKDFLKKQDEESAANVKRNYRHNTPRESKVFKEDPLRHLISY